MRKTKIFKEPNSYQKMTEWAEKNKDKYEMDIIFVENGYGIEYKPLTQILIEPKYERVDNKDVKDDGKFLDKKRDFYIYKSYVPYDYKQSTIVYFVSDEKGNEYGQYPTLELAKKEFEKQVEIDKLDEAINIFEEKIRKQGMITNARDEEQLARLKELRSQY